MRLELQQDRNTAVSVGCPPDADAPHPRQAVVKRVRPPRLQPVRDAILAYMTEPRQAYEIASHTGRATASITGHMRAMLKLGLVDRIAYGRYSRSGTEVVPPRAVALARPHPLTEAIYACLDQPRTAQEIADHLGRPVKRLSSQLRKLRRIGLIHRNQNGALERICARDDTQSQIQSAFRPPESAR